MLKMHGVHLDGHFGGFMYENIKELINDKSLL